ncbi:hypothetical protein B0H13DRAFT_2367122 [Mycena leptocephala]|nr:hypothetical protein B0H13DRAFT_2367122 [Mycena leptocephala]
MTAIAARSTLIPTPMFIFGGSFLSACRSILYAHYDPFVVLFPVLPLVLKKAAHAPDSVSSTPLSCFNTTHPLLVCVI